MEIIVALCLCLSSSVFTACVDELHDIAVTSIDPSWKVVSRIEQPISPSDAPAFVALPRSSSDIQRCLMCASKTGVRVAVKSGGHSFGSYSSVPAPGFMINLHNMKAVSWNGNTSVTVQAGATWGDVYENFRVHGGWWLVTGGLCPSVGVGGYTQGGGVGPVERAFGMAIDNVLEFTLVTANGSTIVKANANMNQDLFWALRGAGGGNFGVVTEMIYRVHPGPEKYTWAQIDYKLHDVQAALLNLGQNDASFPDIINIDMTLDSTSGATLWIVYQGTKDDATVLVNKLLSTGPPPADTHVQEFDCFRELNDAYAKAHGYSNVSDSDFISRGCFVPSLAPEVVERILFGPMPANCGMSILHFGGAIARIDASSTAFPWRKAERYAYITCDYSTPDEKSKTMFYLEQWYEFMHMYCMGGYVNFIEPGLNNWRQVYYGPNLPKLLEVKQKWNPSGTSPLRFPQEI